MLPPSVCNLEGEIKNFNKIENYLQMCSINEIAENETTENHSPLKSLKQPQKLDLQWMQFMKMAASNAWEMRSPRQVSQAF